MNWNDSWFSPAFNSRRRTSRDDFSTVVAPKLSCQAMTTNSVSAGLAGKTPLSDLIKNLDTKKNDKTS